MNEVLGLSVLAAIFCLDITAIGQFMISRPIVCGPVFGYLLGDAKSGLWIGMIVELMWGRSIPMGAAIPHNTTVITIFSVIWGAKSGMGTNSAYVLALALASPLGMLDKKLDILVRTLNIRLVHWVEEGINTGMEYRIFLSVIAGIAAFFLKAFIIFFVLIYPGIWLLTMIYPRLPSLVVEGLDLTWWLLPLSGFGIILAGFHNRFFNFSKQG